MRVQLKSQSDIDAFAKSLGSLLECSKGIVVDVWVSPKGDC